MGNGGCNQEAGDGGLETSGSGPVCVREKVQETHENTNKHTTMEANGTHGQWEMPAVEMRRHQEQQAWEGSGEARTADDHLGPCQEAPGGRDDGEWQEGVLSEGREELGEGGTGAGDSEGSAGRTRKGEKIRISRQQTDDRWRDTRGPKRMKEGVEREQRKRKGMDGGRRAVESENDSKSVKRLRTGVG